MQEFWYCRLTCERAWRAARRKLLGWTSPSSLHDSHPEFHPHLGVSQLRDRLAGTSSEGADLKLLAAALGVRAG